MTVMYAYALYSRNFIKEGYQAIKALADQSLDFGTSFCIRGSLNISAPEEEGCILILPCGKLADPYSSYTDVRYNREKEI